MQDIVKVTAIVLSSTAVGEYDRRIVLLTKEIGKVTVFAKGARRQNSKYIASTDLFTFGEFYLYPGKNSYTLTDAVVGNYFEELRKDFIAAYYGMFFLEICDYYGRENNDDKELLKLLYQSLRALQQPSLSRKLVQSIFEIKSLVVNGEFPGIPVKDRLLESTRYTVEYIISTPIEKLYTFTVSEEVLLELGRICKDYRSKYIDKKFKSLEIINLLEE